MAPPIVHDVLRSPGRPLDATARAYLESRFGHDFGNVRVHADERAAESARAVNAKAYAAGREVVFNRGEYQPRSAAGLASLAHELTHVVQQRAGAAGVPDEIRMGAAGDYAEREAEHDGRGGWQRTAVSVEDEPCLRMQQQTDDQTKKEPPPLIPLPPPFDRLDIKPVFPQLPISPPSIEDVNKGLFNLRNLGQGQGGAANVGCAGALGWEARNSGAAQGLCCPKGVADANRCCPPYRLTFLGRCCPTDQYAKGTECAKFNLPTPTVPAPPPKSPVLLPQGKSS